MISKIKIGLISLSLFALALSVKGQTNKHFKYDIKYCFTENIIPGIKEVDLWVPRKEIKRDSSYFYYNSNNKISIFFKINSYKGSSKLVLIDSLNNLKVTGQFIDGLTLLGEQGEAFNTEGDGIIVVQNYYRGIIDGEWLYYDLKGGVN